MARRDLAKKKRAGKPRKKRSYRSRAILWIFIFMILDEVTPGIPLAEVFIVAILIVLPRWLLNMVHGVYEYVPHKQSWRSVGDICHRNVLTISPQASVTEAAGVMGDEQVRSLIVVERREALSPPGDQGDARLEPASKKQRGKKSREKPAKPDYVLYPVGIITDRDIALRVEAEGLPWEETTVAEAMTAGIEVVQGEVEVHFAVERMGELGIRQMPVVDSQGNLMGILSLDDIIAMLSDSLDDMVELLRREAQKEAEVRS